MKDNLHHYKILVVGQISCKSVGGPCFDNIKFAQIKSFEETWKQKKERILK